MTIPYLSTAVAVSTLMLSSTTFAQSPQAIGKDFCDTNANCFNQTYHSAKPVNIQQAQKFAWRPGYYKNDRDGNRSRNYRRSRSSGSSFWGGFRSVSVPKTGPVNPRGTVVFNPRHLTYAAYDSSGSLVKSGRASGGMGWCEDVGRPCRTPIGRFRVHNKGTAACVSRKYPLGEGGAPMPHCMYFNGGYAMHGSYHVPNYNASHGCIRLHPPEAAWLHRNFVKVGTVVVVKSY